MATLPGMRTATLVLLLCLGLDLSVSKVAALKGVHQYAQNRQLLDNGFLANGSPVTEASPAAESPNQQFPSTHASACPPGANFTSDQEGNGSVDVTADEATVHFISLPTDHLPCIPLWILISHVCMKSYIAYARNNIFMGP